MTFPLFAVAAVPSELEGLTSAPELLRGEFIQSKYISALDTEFESSGTFEYRRNQAIEWRTVAPIENVLVMTPDRIINRQAGNELSRLESDSNPVVSVFSDIFFGVMTAEWGKLAQYFSFKLKRNGESWTVHLVPIDSSVEQVVSSVELNGDELLREVVLHEAAGDLTRIRFKDMQP